VTVSLSARGSSATSASRRARHHVCALALGRATPGIAGIAFADIYKVWSQEKFPTLLRATAQRTTISFVASTAATRRCRSH
jgi:hypothetical protein